jgi:hypothetical protein
MRVFSIFIFLVTIIAIQWAAVLATSTEADSPGKTPTLVGRWRVKFNFSGDRERNLVFEARTKGSGSFLLMDTGPDDKLVAGTQPTGWAQLTDSRVSFSGEVELPIGTCCREIGTLMFKGRFISNNSISGKLVFVTSVDEEESPYKFRSLVGTFTATRIPTK